MKIDDSFFYRKNALTNYMMSEALSKHRGLLKKENKSKINSFIFPVLSAIVSIFLAKELEGTLKNWLVIVLLIPAYLILYYSISNIFVFVQDKVLATINKYWDKRKKYDPEELCYKFNYNIVNQIYYSYSLINDIDGEKDTYMIDYNVYESFINFENSINELNQVFNKETIEYFQEVDFGNIYIFRIKLYFSMLEAVYNKLLEFDAPEKIGNIKLSNLREKYNRLVDTLNSDGKISIKKIAMKAADSTIFDKKK